MSPKITPVYSLVRFVKGRAVFSMDEQNHIVTKGIVAIVWGTVPRTLEDGGAIDEEWKFALGGDNWLIVKRTQ